MGEIRRGGHRIGAHGWEPVGNAPVEAPVKAARAAADPQPAVKEPQAPKPRKVAARKAPKPRKR